MEYCNVCISSQWRICTKLFVNLVLISNHSAKTPGKGFVSCVQDGIWIETMKTLPSVDLLSLDNLTITLTLSIFQTDQSKGERCKQAIQPSLKHQPKKYGTLSNQGQTTTPGTPCPTLYGKCVGSLTSPASHVTLKVQETGPMVFSSCQRRLERLTICRCLYKGSTSSSVIFKILSAGSAKV